MLTPDKPLLRDLSFQLTESTTAKEWGCERSACYRAPTILWGQCCVFSPYISTDIGRIALSPLVKKIEVEFNRIIISDLPFGRCFCEARKHFPLSSSLSRTELWDTCTSVPKPWQAIYEFVATVARKMGPGRTRTDNLWSFNQCSNHLKLRAPSSPSNLVRCIDIVWR